MTTQRARYARARWLSIVVLITGLCVTAFAYWQSRRMVSHDREVQWNILAADIRSQIERQVRDYTLIMRGSKAYLTAQPQHSATTFQVLVRSFDIAHRSPGLRSIGYAQRQPGVADDLSMAVVVRYQEYKGDDGVAEGPGADLFTQESWQPAIADAMTTGTLSAGLGMGQASGMLMLFLPVFDGVVMPQDPATRTPAFAGGVFLRLRIADMLDYAIGPGRQEWLSSRVWQRSGLSAGVADQNVYYHDAGANRQTVRERWWWPVYRGRDDLQPATFALPIGNASWQVTLTPRPYYGDSPWFWLPLASLFGGLLLSVLLFGSIRRLGYAGQVSEDRASRATQSLHDAEQQLADVLASLSEVLWTLRIPGGHVTYASPAVRQVYGSEPDAFLRTPGLWREFIHPQDRGRMDAFLDSLTEERSTAIYCRIVRNDGQERWLRYNAKRTVFQVNPEGGDWTGRIDLVGSDVTDEYLLQESVRLRQRAIEASANAIIITRASGPGYPIEYVNPAFERMTGYSAAEMLGNNMRMLRRDDHDQPGVNELRAALKQCREGSATFRNYRKDGSLFWTKVYVAPVRNEAGEVSHFVAAKYDITETKRYEAQLEHQATHDALTGLANRNLLRTRLIQAISDIAEVRQPLWVAFLDLDHFKFINDTLGHGAGDVLLQQIARRLQHTLRAEDTLARQGGDEFVLVLRQGPGVESNAFVLQRIMEVVQQPLKVDGHSFYTSFSVGVAVYPGDGEHPETLVKNADIAMYHAKEAGRNNIQFFSAEMNTRAMDRLRLEADLRQALATGQFVLHYQPQVDVVLGRITGVEALIRWQHPELGLIPPGQFIALAEETGLIVPIGVWVMRMACTQVQAWREQGLGPLQVSVNLSARQFSDSDLLQAIDDVLRETGLNPGQLELELTETLLMTNVACSSQILSRLKERGLRVQIDDFGTGYSSLAYLKRFPLDVLKVDRSFVNDIAVNAADAAIVQTIISLAQGLGLGVIAEGVETHEQLLHLQAKGCHCMQGYYFSKPLPAGEMEILLRRAAHDLRQLWDTGPS